MSQTSLTILDFTRRLLSFHRRTGITYRACLKIHCFLKSQELNIEEVKESFACQDGAPRHHLLAEHKHNTLNSTTDFKMVEEAGMRLLPGHREVPSRYFSPWAAYRKLSFRKGSKLRICKSEL